AAHEAARQAGCVAARDRGVQRSVGPITPGAHDAEVAEQVADAVRGVDETPGTDRERAGEPRIRARRGSRVRRPGRLERVAAVDRARRQRVLRDGRGLNVAVTDCTDGAPRCAAATPAAARAAAAMAPNS